jgi:hypothetical protein
MQVLSAVNSKADTAIHTIDTAWTTCTTAAVTAAATVTATVTAVAATPPTDTTHIFSLFSEPLMLEGSSIVFT